MYIYISIYIYNDIYIYIHIYIYIICSHTVGNLRDYDYCLPISTAGPTKKPYEVPVICEIDQDPICIELDHLMNLIA